MNTNCSGLKIKTEIAGAIHTIVNVYKNPGVIDFKCPEINERLDGSQHAVNLNVHDCHDVDINCRQYNVISLSFTNVSGDVTITKMKSHSLVTIYVLIGNQYPKSIKYDGPTQKLELVVADAPNVADYLHDLHDRITSLTLNSISEYASLTVEDILQCDRLQTLKITGPVPTSISIDQLYKLIHHKTLKRVIISQYPKIAEMINDILKKEKPSLTDGFKLKKAIQQLN